MGVQKVDRLEKIDGVRFLESLARECGSGALVRAVSDAVDRLRWRTHPHLTREEFLEFHRVRATHQAAMNKTTGAVKDFKKLAALLRALKITLPMLLPAVRLAPWDAWEDDAVVAAVLGARRGESASRGCGPWVAGARDLQALSLLVSVLRETADIRFRLEVHLASIHQSPVEAEALLATLAGRPDVGAVAVLGSPRANPAADPMARLILPGLEGEELPARFRWTSPPGEKAAFLADPGRCQPGEEGIRCRGHGQTTLPCIDCGAGARHARLQDAGLLAMSSRQSPLLVLAAGHGGRGTVAAVLGLSRGEYVEQRLLDPARSGLTHGVLFEPVWVRLRRRAAAALAPPVSSGDYGQAWGFAWDA